MEKIAEKSGAAGLPDVSEEHDYRENIASAFATPISLVESKRWARIVCRQEKMEDSKTHLVRPPGGRAVEDGKAG